MTNEQIIAKLAKLESVLKATTSASDAELSPEQITKFIQTTVDEADFLKRIGLVQMLRDKRKLYTLGLDSRILRKRVSQTAPTPSGYNKGERALDCVDTVLAVDIPFEVLEENIEEENFEATLTEIFTKQYANDLCDLIINGDETADDDFLEINNGIIKIADTDDGVHKETFEEGDTVSDVFKRMMKSMPNKWKRNKKDLLFLVSPEVEEEYRDEVSKRQTAGGDSALTGDANIPYKGVEVYPVSQMPSGTRILVNPKNLVLGWHKRYMRIGRWVNERKGQIEYTITAKTDQEYAVSDAIVKYKLAS